MFLYWLWGCLAVPFVILDFITLTRHEFIYESLFNCNCFEVIFFSIFPIALVSLIIGSVILFKRKFFG